MQPGRPDVEAAWERHPLRKPQRRAPQRDRHANRAGLPPAGTDGWASASALESLPRPATLRRKQQSAEALTSIQADRPAAFHAACGYGKTALVGDAQRVPWLVRMRAGTCAAGHPPRCGAWVIIVEVVRQLCQKAQRNRRPRRQPDHQAGRWHPAPAVLVRLAAPARGEDRAYTRRGAGAVPGCSTAEPSHRQARNASSTSWRLSPTGRPRLSCALRIRYWTVFLCSINCSAVVL